MTGAEEWSDLRHHLHSSALHEAFGRKIPQPGATRWGVSPTAAGRWGGFHTARGVSDEDGAGEVDDLGLQHSTLHAYSDR